MSTKNIILLVGVIIMTIVIVSVVDNDSYSIDKTISKNIVYSNILIITLQ